MRFKIAIIGLGLMGASLARALKGFRDCEVRGCDADEDVCRRAVLSKTVDRADTDAKKAVINADVIIFCVYARHIPRILRSVGEVIKPGAVLGDICGVKTLLYGEIEHYIPTESDYIGLHPMAGGEKDGFDNANAAMFKGSGFIITPLKCSNAAHIALFEHMAEYIGAARITAVPYKKHDDIIAYTSDLMHVSAAALCVDMHKDISPEFCAGAFRDCTRIADINAAAWTELLLENKENTARHIGVYIDNLTAIMNALNNNDDKTLYSMLQKAGNNKRGMIRT